MESAWCLTCMTVILDTFHSHLLWHCPWLSSISCFVMKVILMGCHGDRFHPGCIVVLYPRAIRESFIMRLECFPLYMGVNLQVATSSDVLVTSRSYSGLHSSLSWVMDTLISSGRTARTLLNPIEIERRLENVNKDQLFGLTDWIKVLVVKDNQICKA